MTRDEAYKAITQIVDDPKNAEKLDKYRLSTKENGVGLKWYLNNAKEMLKVMELKPSNNTPRTVLESSFDVSIHHIQNILKQENLL